MLHLQQLRGLMAGKKSREKPIYADVSELDSSYRQAKNLER